MASSPIVYRWYLCLRLRLVAIPTVSGGVSLLEWGVDITIEQGGIAC